MLSAIPSEEGAQPSSARGRRLEVLFAEHGRAVFAFARRRASAADADEVVSETFLVAWRRLDDLPPEPLPWLLGVARKCLANINRREDRQGALHRRLEAVSLEPTCFTEEPDRAAALDALEQMSQGERDAVTLLAWEGLTPAEAAVALGCSRAAIYLRLHRVRRRLADHLPSKIEHEEHR